MSLRTIDHYLLRSALPAMAGVLFTTMLAFLLERLLRSFDLLAQSSRGGYFLLQLAVNLVPHYIGLTLPGGFFIGLFVVIDRLNKGSEIDALLASGVSLGRIAAPFVGLGVLLMVFSIALYGFVQPYSRYAYRGVLHAVLNAGWNGEVPSMALLTPNRDLVLTADEAAPTGQSLQRVFIRTRRKDGEEHVLTAASADLRRNRDNQSITLTLKNGQDLSTTARGEARLLSFTLMSLRLPLAPAATLFRARGAQEAELTLVELAQQGFSADPPVLPRQALLAELFSRLSRALALPLMPFLATPLALTAKRAGSAPGMAVAGVLLFAFQASLIFTQGLASAGRTSAALGEGLPTLAFAGCCIGAFLLSRKRPGENPVNWLAERLGEAIAVLIRRRRDGAAPDA